MPNNEEDQKLNADKNSEEQPQKNKNGSNDLSQENSDEVYIREIDEKVNIHVMPEKFRANRENVKKAKSIGIIIIILGIFFLIAMIVVLYIFIFTDSGSDKIKQSNNVEKIDFKKEQNLPQDDSSKMDQKDDDENNKDLDNNKDDDSDMDQKDDDENNKDLDNNKDDDVDKINLQDKQADIPDDMAISDEIIDSDKDGLSDKEELILGTSSLLIDSDKDGYNDIAELENLYNPAGDGKLVENPSISELNNVSFDYQILYPSDWEKSVVGGDDSVIISSGSGHFMQIIIQPNVEEEKIEDWLIKQLDAEEVASYNKTNKDKWYGIENSEGNVMYITDIGKQYIYVISYSSDSAELPIYSNIYKMIINSFTITE